MIKIENTTTNVSDSGVGVFLARQDDRPGASKKRLAIAARIGKRLCWSQGL